ncbi:MAG: hypothetical protein AAF621_00565 [Pseudomonadota bacterium]
MPFAGSTYSRLYSWVADRDANINILASKMDEEMDGFTSAINQILQGSVPFTGAIKGSSGAASAPAMAFSNDTDTGIYRIGANNLGIAVGGANKFDLNSTRLRLPVASKVEVTGDVASGASDHGSFIKGPTPTLTFVDTDLGHGSAQWQFANNVLSLLGDTDNDELIGATSNGSDENWLTISSSLFRYKGLDVWHTGNDDNLVKADEANDMSGLLSLSVPQEEQIRVGYNTGAQRNCAVNLYDGLTNRIGYLRGEGENLEIASDGNFYIDIDTDDNSTTRLFAIRDHGLTNRFIVFDDGYTSIKRGIPGASTFSIVHEGATSALDAGIFMDFRYSLVTNGPTTRLGFLGPVSTSDTHMYLGSDVGEVRINPATGNPLRVTGNEFIIDQQLAILTLQSDSGYDQQIRFEEGAGSLQGLVIFDESANELKIDKYNNNSYQCGLHFANDYANFDSLSEVRVNNNKLWHAGNDGSGTGLDADLLDGQHGSYYLNPNNLSTIIPNSKLPVIDNNKIGAAFSWNPVIRNGNGSTISASDASFSAIAIGDIVHCRYEANMAGGGTGDAAPYINLPTAAAGIQNLGLCWASYSSDPDGNIEDLNAVDWGTMVARGGNAYFKNSGYDLTSGAAIDVNYLVLTFQYQRT